MSSNKPEFIEMYNREFKELTTLGNDFRIRHHEISKIDIEDDLLYKYFYKRCISLISTALEYLD